jgi:SAM-dependent methyltransferase
MDGESAHAASDRAKFDAFAQDYTAGLRDNVRVTGEQPEYFAGYKLRCINRLVGAEFDGPVLDYGCGVGLVTSELCRRFSEVHGFDPSAQSLMAARERAPKAKLHPDIASVPAGHFALVVMSGVLHHVHPQERDAVLARAIEKLRPGDGRLVVFEHNPLNPLTRRAVAACPFDDDAVLLWPWEATRGLRRAGLHDVKLRFIVFFPRFLSALRGLEPTLGTLPIGAQVMVVGRRA